MTCISTAEKALLMSLSLLTDELLPIDASTSAYGSAYESS